MKKKQTMLLVAGILIVGATVAAIVISNMKTEPGKAPEPKTQTPQERTKYIASDNFKNLSIEDKKNYVRKSMEKGSPRDFFRSHENLSDDERKKLHQNMRTVFHAMRKERVDKYFELKTPQEKLAYLDKQIDERLERHKKMQEHFNNMSDDEKAKMRSYFSRRSDSSGNKDGKDGKPESRRRGPSLDRIKKRIETSDPKERAQRTEFRMAMRARMEQRGIKEPWRRPGGGGGPGGGGKSPSGGGSKKERQQNQLNEIKHPFPQKGAVLSSNGTSSVFLV